MRRIGLATILALSVVLAPLTPAAPQQAGKVWHLGVLSPSNTPSEAARRQSPLIQKLNELGWVENRNLLMEYRYADGKIDRLADLAIELVQSNVDAIFTVSTPGVQAARKATGTIPIVFIGINDPVGLGLVASLAHPGGNVTGISTLLTGDLVAKQLQILKEVVPRVSRVATLWNPANPASATALKETQAIAPALGIRIVPVAMQTPGELEIAVATVLRDRSDALLVHPTAPMSEQRVRILGFALKNQLPTVSGTREFAAAGALMTYGPDLARDVRTAAVYLDKIFKGSKPADLPVEQPTQLELVINLKTAKALGLTIPQTLLQRADQVIQ
jgi:putative tryptophan/tyrosine transport system substrate-binding protein